jgi:hypothetical protein
MNAAAGLTRLRGLVILSAFVAAGTALAGPRPDGYLHGSIYPWWAWALVGAGVVAGTVVLLAPGSGRGRPARTVAACVAWVVGAELFGTGVVARKHWEPARGMAGFGEGQMGAVELLALVVAVASAVAVLAATSQLLADRVFAVQQRNRTWWVQVGMGTGLVLALPFVLGAAQPADFDVTTWGAAGLIYAGPWGMAVAASAWCARLAATALLGTVLGCAALAGIGPQMVDLLPLSVDLLFVGVALMILVLALAVGRVRQVVRP